MILKISSEMYEYKNTHTYILNYAQNPSEYVKNGKHWKIQHFALCSNKIKVSVPAASGFQERCLSVVHLPMILGTEQHVYKVPKVS